MKTACFDEVKKIKFRTNLERADSLRNMTYDEKVHYSKSMIKKAILDYDRKVAVACSFGKDSTVMVHLCYQFSDIPVVFCNTGVEYKETLDFRDVLVEKWNLNYVELHPETTYFKVVRKSGYPQIRMSSYSAKKRKKSIGTPKCCYYLKEKPMKLWVNSNHFKAYFVGLQADESYQRKWTIIKYGDNYVTSKVFNQPIHKFLPLAYWSEKEIWRYIKENKLPMNKAYERYGISRVGCVPCTGHIGWEKTLQKVNVKMYAKIKRDMTKTRPIETYFTN